jgi:hypothetical protein
LFLFVFVSLLFIILRLNIFYRKRLIGFLLLRNFKGLFLGFGAGLGLFLGGLGGFLGVGVFLGGLGVFLGVGGFSGVGGFRLNRL